MFPCLNPLSRVCHCPTAVPAQPVSGGRGGLSQQCRHPVETLAMLDFRPDAFPGEPQLFSLKIRDLPGAAWSHNFEVVLLGFSSMEMESPGRGQDMARLDLVSLQRVD